MKITEEQYKKNRNILHSLLQNNGECVNVAGLRCSRCVFKNGDGKNYCYTTNGERKQSILVAIADFESNGAIV